LQNKKMKFPIAASGGVSTQQTNEIRYVAYYHPRSDIRISKITKEIIDKFFEYKKEHSEYNQ